MIGIIGAMEMEVEDIKARMEIAEEIIISSVRYFVGSLAGKEAVVAKCSPGKVNAAICAQSMLLRFQPSLIINPGVAGGIGPGVHIGDLVVGTSCVQHDADTTALGDPPGTLTIGRENVISLPCGEKESEKFAETARRIYAGTVHRGVIATGDQFVADGEKCLTLLRDFEAIACEMEGGAIAQACCLAGIPFVALRSISDNANEAGKVDFSAFARQSAEKAARLLCDTLPLL